MKSHTKSDLPDAVKKAEFADTIKKASKVKNVRYYTYDGTQVNKVISELEDMSPEMAVYIIRYIIRMAAASVFPELEKSRGQEIISTFETENGKRMHIEIDLNA